MKPRWQVQLTLPEKDKPYTQADMDVAIGHPVNLRLAMTNGTQTALPPMMGTITAAEIQPDGSAVVTMEVESP